MVRPEDFLTNTGIAYLLFLIAVILFIGLVYLTSEKRSKSK